MKLLKEPKYQARKAVLYEPLYQARMAIEKGNLEFFSKNLQRALETRTKTGELLVIRDG